MRLLELAFAAAVAVSTSAVAQTAQPPRGVQSGEAGAVWKQCDGFGGPSMTGDGMTTYASTLLLFIASKGGDTFRKEPSAMRESIAACDQDLADPLIRDRYHLRRASLLRAKAIHQLSAGEARAALETLDLADKVNADAGDGFYKRSFGLGVDYVRAYAMNATGDREAARTLARNTSAQRPYSTEMALAASILLSRTGSREDARAALESESRLNPRRIDFLFLEAMDANRLNDALMIYPHLVPPRQYPKAPGYNFQVMMNVLENRATGEVFWASRGSMRAVALAALGRGLEAQEALSQARARATEAAGATVPLVLDGRAVKSKWLPGYAASLNAQIAKETAPIFDRAAEQLPDILRESGKPLEADRGAAKPFGGADEELSALLSTLPEVEIADRVPPYGPVNRSIFADASGYTETADPAKGITKIAYRTYTGTSAVAEEMALLRAAQFAQAQGKAGFVISDRRDIRHTLAVSTYPGIAGQPAPDGFSVELDVVAVDPTSLPQPYREAAWRVIDAGAVVTALAHVYPPRAPKTRAR